MWSSYICPCSVFFFLLETVEVSKPLQLSGLVFACLDFSTNSVDFWDLCLNNQMRWWGDSVTTGKQQIMLGGCTFPSLLTPPAGLNETRQLECFAPLLLMCLWSNERSGPLVLTHYLDTELAFRRGRLFNSDKPGMLLLCCHFKAYSAV